MAGITSVTVRGLDIGKLLHNAGSVMILLAYVILLGLPVWALARGTITHFEPLLTLASMVHYAIAYIALFALPIFGRKALHRRLPAWLKVAAGAGMASSLVALLISVYPVVDVVSRLAFAGKICAVVR